MIKQDLVEIVYADSKWYVKDTWIEVSPQPICVPIIRGGSLRTNADLLARGLLERGNHDSQINAYAFSSSQNPHTNSVLDMLFALQLYKI